MTLLTRYLLSRQVGPLLVALLLFCGLVWLLQALRLGHHLIGAGLGPAAVGQALLYSLPALLVFALPLALFAAVLYALGRLAESNELLLLTARGASPLQLALPGLYLGAACAVIAALLAGFVEAPALERLQRSLLQSAARSLVLSPQPRRFHRLFDGATIYVDRTLGEARGGARFGGLLLALQRPPAGAPPAQRAAGRAPALLLAREATVRLGRGGRIVTLDLADGELQLLGADGALRRMRFGRLEHRLDLGRALDAHLGFLAELARAERALTAPAACLALALLATAVGLGRGSRLRLALSGLAAVGLFQLGLLLAGQLGQAWLDGGGVAGATRGSLALCAAVTLGSLGWIGHRSRRRRGGVRRT